MTIDSRAKGRTAEYKVRDLMRDYTGLEWERTPHSGALSYIKSDIYIPHHENNFLIEVKHYEESIFDIKIFTNKSNNFKVFWEKVNIQAKDKEQEPLLIFKHNRSKFYLATRLKPEQTKNFLYVAWLNCYILLAEEWLEEESVNVLWVRN
jgi:hypothetical protein